MIMGFIIQRWKVRNPPLHTEAERKYTGVAARGTPVYFRENLLKNLRTPVFKFSLEFPYLTSVQVFIAVPITDKFSRESSNFLTGFYESKRESRAHPPLYICALLLYTQVDFSLSTSV